MNSNKTLGRKKVMIGLIVLGMIILNANIFAQTEEWKTENTKDGKITVKSKISERTDEKGGEVQLIEYVATTTASVNLQNCISVIKDVSNHKDIMDDEVSKIVETISDNEWILYYYTDSHWPMPDSDCVSKMVYSEDQMAGVATFTLTAVPDRFKKTDVKRMTIYNVTYEFKDLGKDKVEMTVTAQMSPTIQAPDWMVRSFFPNGPADVLRKIIKLANKN